LDDETIDMLMTSPPYYQLRHYGTDPIEWDDGEYQLGLEPTIEMFVNHLCDIFDDVKRVLKSYGSVWVNIGDTYAGGTPGVGGDTGKHKSKDGSVWGASTRFKSIKPDWMLPDGCVCGVPWRFAIEMCNRGWTLRNDNIWWKPNAMPDSAKTRFTSDHEYVFFFTKMNKGYYFEQQLEPHKVIDRRSKDKLGKRIVGRTTYFKGEYQRGAYLGQGLHGKNKRTVWRVNTKPSGVKHYATYPEKLVATPIKAGCPLYVCTQCGMPLVKVWKRIQDSRPPDSEYENGRTLEGWQSPAYSHRLGDAVFKDQGYAGCDCNADFEPGVVIDPFAGIGTTLITAYKLDRHFIGFELSKEFYEIAKMRLKEAMSNTKITDFMTKPKKGPIERFVVGK
jgi:site-specific DNA-methyltransferase (adenine-specific)